MNARRAFLLPIFVKAIWYHALTDAILSVRVVFEIPTSPPMTSITSAYSARHLRPNACERFAASGMRSLTITPCIHFFQPIRSPSGSDAGLSDGEVSILGTREVGIREVGIREGWHARGLARAR